MAAKKTTKATPSLSDVKANLVDFDREGLPGLTQDLYAASQDSKAFLHVRLGLGDDPLNPTKLTIRQWINPTDYRKLQSVAKVKKAISDYKKAPALTSSVGTAQQRQVAALSSAG